ncbi:MAG: protein phosphatase 2C domain-containing protein [Candidatus Marinimicrobia bacterium]|nr:protein phosphatase 2C domain-containing protein [Candidatus Neomarinimicrobiota bacterium]
MNLLISAVSDKGRMRSRNEDMLFSADSFVRNNSLEHNVRINSDHPVYFLAVADGMGGPPAGDVASEFVLRETAAGMRKLPPGLTTGQLKEKTEKLLRDVHRHLRKKGEKDVHKRGMGTTMTGLLFYEGGIFSLHVGDSRLYEYTNGRLRQLSKDHTLKEMLGDPNIPSSILTNAFGTEEDIRVDFAKIAGDVLPGTTYLLCSDGLSDMLRTGRSATCWGQKIRQIH